MKIIKFSKAFVPCALLSMIIVIAGAAGLLTKKINFGIDFQAGFIETVRIAPTAAELSYTGPKTVLFSQNSSEISVTATSVDGQNNTYRFAFADNPTVKDLKDGLSEIEGLTVKISASAERVLLRQLFSDYESSSKLSAAGMRLHYINTAVKPVTADQLRHALSAVSSVSVQQIGDVGDSAFQVRLPDDGKYENANTELKGLITSALNNAYGAENVAVIGTDFVGSRFSASLARQAVLLVAGALILIFVYAMFRFQWNFSLAAILSLIHDTLIMLAFIIWTQMEFNSTTIAAILTIIGYSINDTIVIFDRIREKIGMEPKLECNEVIDSALTEIFSRTVITTVTTMLAAVSLFVFTTGSMKDFAAALLVGLVSGTYSSIFIACAFISWTSKGKKGEQMITRGKKTPGEFSGVQI